MASRFLCVDCRQSTVKDPLICSRQRLSRCPTSVGEAPLCKGEGIPRNRTVVRFTSGNSEWQQAADNGIIRLQSSAQCTITELLFSHARFRFVSRRQQTACVTACSKEHMFDNLIIHAFPQRRSRCCGRWPLLIWPTEGICHVLNLLVKFGLLD